MNDPNPDTHLLTRRRAIAVGAAAVSAAISAATLPTFPLAADAAEPDDKWIDAHSHIWSADFDRYPLAPKVARADLDPPTFTDDELMAIAGPEGVDRVVLIQHSVFHLFDNSYVLDAVQRHPRRFRAVGMIDESAPSPGAEMKRMLPLGTTGYRITPFVRDEPPGKWIDTPGMHEMWKTAVDTRQNMCCLIDARYLPEVDKMCAAHPDTPVVIDHFARIGADGTFPPADIAKLCGLAKYKHTAVKLSAFYFLGKKQPPYLELAPMIKQLLEAFGPDRLMWASDSPYQLQKGNTYAASIALIRDKLDFITPADRKKLLRTTAERVFFYS